jgi:serine/threonine protein kinase
MRSRLYVLTCHFDRMHQDSQADSINKAQFIDEEEFERERRVYEKLRHIPNLRGRIPRYYGVIDTPEDDELDSDFTEQALRLEYIDGQTLEELRLQIGYEELQIEEIGHAIEEILDLLHAEGIAHQDLYATNVMIRSDEQRPLRERVVLIDFNLAVWREDAHPDVWARAQRKDFRNLRAIVRGDV